MKVAYQGEPGAYSERAVLALFPDGDPLPCETVRLVFSRVTSGEAEAGVVPVENSQAGSVNETYDLLLRTALLGIHGEVVVRVDHALLAPPGARLEGIERVLSHWQALAQCEEFLNGLGADMVSVHDTAGAARIVAEHADPHEAAVASVEAGDRFGLKVLAEQLSRLPAVTIEANATEEGHLYGSIGPGEISKTLKGKNLMVEADMVKLETHIKEANTLTEVPLNLGYGIEAKIQVLVVALQGGRK